MRYGEMKTTHWFSELVVKLEIIKISLEFVAGFCISENKKLLMRTSREKHSIRSTRDPALRLKNGSGRDDATRREITRAPDEFVRGYR